MAGDITEIEQAKIWIAAALAGNADITAEVSTRIYADFVPSPPDRRVFPYCLFNFMAGSDIDGLGTVRLATLPLFQVRVVTEGRPTATVKKVDKRIDDVLGVAVYQPSGDYYFTARREQPINREEFNAATGKHYLNLGGLFRLFISKTV